MTGPRSFVISHDQTWLGASASSSRLRVVRMAPLVPALSDLAVLLQNPIHRANRAEVGSLVQKRGPHLGGRLVDEPLTVQGPEDFLALSLVEGSVRPRTPLRYVSTTLRHSRAAFSEPRLASGGSWRRCGPHLHRSRPRFVEQKKGVPQVWTPPREWLVRHSGASFSPSAG